MMRNQKPTAGPRNGSPYWPMVRTFATMTRIAVASSGSKPGAAGRCTRFSSAASAAVTPALPWMRVI